jgi:hypothetical protein
MTGDIIERKGEIVTYHIDGFQIEVVFKERLSDDDLTPEEIELLEACYGKILEQIEVEEKRIIERDRRAALETDMSKLERLRQAIDDGLNSGPATHWQPNEIKREGRKRRDARLPEACHTPVTRP